MTNDGIGEGLANNTFFLHPGSKSFAKETKSDLWRPQDNFYY